MFWIALQEVRTLLKDRGTLIWAFVMPPLFFFFIGSVMGGSSAGLGLGTAVPLAVASAPESGFLVEPFLGHLAEAGYQVVRVPTVLPEPLPHQEALDQPPDPEPPRRKLTLPSTFTKTLLAGEPTALILETPRTGLGEDLDNLRVKRAAYTTVADLLAIRAQATEDTVDAADTVDAVEAVPITADALERLAAWPRALTLEVRPAGERQKVPSGFEQSIPGNLVMFVLMVMLTSGAVSLVQERQQGILRRLASAPLRPVSVVFGKWAGRMLLAALQIASALVVAALLFPIDWGPDLPMLVVVLLAWGAFCTSLGLLLGNVARTEGQVIGLGVFSTLSLAALGGCWWPIEITPLWMQTLAHLLPTGWTMAALHRLITFQTGAGGAVGYLVLLIVATLAVGWVAGRRFRFV